MERANYEEILKRIASVTNTLKPKELGIILEITPAAVSKALTKKHIPRTWYTTLITKFNISYEWLIYGVTKADVVNPTPKDQCMRCIELYERLREVSERLDNSRQETIAALQENILLKEEINRLSRGLQPLKNQQQAL